jgi:hypothetical protein
MALDIRAVKYTDDAGGTFQTGMAQYILSQVNGSAVPLVGVGAQVSGDGALDPLPRGFRPRITYVSNAANGKTRAVVCLTTDAPLYTGTSTSINLQDGAGDVLAYTRVKRRGELPGRTRHIG